MHDRAVRRHPALVAPLVAATLLLLGALGTLAGPFITGALVQVSGTSPFAGCTADDVAGQIARDPTGPRKVYLNSEVEPWADVNPTNPNTLIEDENPRFLNDKQSITADPTDPHLVYAVWDRLKESTGNLINPERVPGDLSFKGAAMFTRTTDAGASWEPARVLYDPGAISQTIGNQLVVLPDGTLVAFFDEIFGVRNSAGPGPFNLSFKS